MLGERAGSHAFAAWQNVGFFIWTARADDQTTEQFERAIATVSGRYPEGRSIVSVIAENVPPPPDRLRTLCVNLLTKPAPGLSCMVVVVEGDGFMSSTMRSFHTGLRIQSTRSFEYGVLDKLDELKNWLPERHLKRTGVRLSPVRLDGVAHELMQRAKLK